MADEQDSLKTDDSKDEESCYSYEGNICIYTDPETHIQYQWDEEKKNWAERSCRPNKFSEDDTGHDYVYDGETYIYTDKEGVKFRWNVKTSEWIKISDDEADKDNLASSSSTLVDDLKSGAYDFKDRKHTYTDPSDGTVFEWDNEKSAWFPKLDEDFLAHYQMNYGFTQETETDKKEKSGESKHEEEKPEMPEENLLKRKGPPPPPSWFEVDDQHNTKVYVSNLPYDITDEEFLDIMQKCGLVMKDSDTNRMKIKLYTDSEGRPKGDALCSYIKIESVELALNLLDGMDIRGHKIHVERAKFQMKGDAYNANLKPRKKRKRDKEKLKKMQEKLFDWRPDKMRGERPGNERVVVLKNLFEAGLFDKNAALLLEYREDLREECSKCGKLKKVVIHDRHPEGVAQVYFQDAEEADICVKLLNGRWFGQRRIVAETWDGKTKYRVEETEEEKEKRLQNWAKFLETGEGGPGGSSGDTGASDKGKTVDVVDVVQAPTQNQKFEVDDAHSNSDATRKEVDENAMPVKCHLGSDENGSANEYGGSSNSHDNEAKVPPGKAKVLPDEAETDSNPEGDSDDQDCSA